MVYVEINELLQKKKKTKYWLIKQTNIAYQSITKLINNETTGIKFDTLDKICIALECQPEDILKYRRK